MDEKKLNIRVYNAGIGDCIYIYVPHPHKEGREHACHILIDCGTVSEGMNFAIQKAQEDLSTLLPKLPNGQNRLDLLIISHPHGDHYSGFDPSRAAAKGTGNSWYSQFRVGRLWLTTLLDKGNTQAQKAREIGSFAWQELARLVEFASSGMGQALEISPALAAAAREAKEDKDRRQTILDALIKQAGKSNTLYVSTTTPEHQLRLFPGDDNAIRFRVLSPVREIDKTYLGQGLIQSFDQYRGYRKRGGAPLSGTSLQDVTVSINDFRIVYNSLIGNTLALAMKSGDMYNITGLVLLLEWKGYRLLFAGDAEYTSPTSRSEEKGAWNVIWDRHLKSGGKLLQPVHFLKVGHHGSINATPWSDKKKIDSINVILETLIQKPTSVPAGTEKAPCFIVVSTERFKYPSIPYAPLMRRLGELAANRRQYDEFEGYYRPRIVKDPKKSQKEGYEDLLKANSVPADVFQPQRTDLHVQDPACKATYTDENGMRYASYIDFSFPP